MNQEIVKKAFVKTLPVLAGYVVLGTGFGILLRKVSVCSPAELLSSQLS